MLFTSSESFFHPPGSLIPYRIYVVVFKWRARSSIFYLSGRHAAALKIFTPPEGVHRVFPGPVP